MNTLILGMGNLLLGDEGVGVHAARALSKRQLPDGVTVLDVGTALLDALPALARAERAIVIDAVKGGQAPGTVYRMPVEDFARKPVIASMHGFDLPRVLALAERTEPLPVVVVGVEPARIEWSLELSPDVAAALPGVLEVVTAELGTAGGPTPRSRWVDPGNATRKGGNRVGHETLTNDPSDSQVGRVFEHELPEEDNP